MRTIYSADWIIPVSDNPIKNGAVLVNNGFIEDLGYLETIRKKYQLPVEEYKNAVIAPAWVNAHCHLELSYMKKRIPQGINFVEWVKALIHFRETDSFPTKVRVSFELELEKLARTGTALIGDVTNGDFLYQIKSSVERVIFFEMIGFKSVDSERLFKTAKEKIMGFPSKIYLAPHAVYSTSAELIKLIIAGNEISTIHVAESSSEMRLLLDGSGPFRIFLEERNAWDSHWQAPFLSPIAYLHKTGVLSKKLILVHGVHVNNEDINLIKENGNSVCLCLRSNHALASGMPPVVKYLENRVPLCIGTDSLASNSDLDMNAEVAYLSSCFPQIFPDEILKMGTINGARALGRDSEFGSISVGKKAKLNIYLGLSSNEIEPERFVVSKSWSELKCI